MRGAEGAGRQIVGGGGMIEDERGAWRRLFLQRKISLEAQPPQGAVDVKISDVEALGLNVVGQQLL